MDEWILPKRLFKTGCQAAKSKKVNCYFKLQWIETIKKALNEEQNQLLAESQFKNIMKMGEHTFSVQFLHYLLTLQLVTTRKFELWWTYSGKPVRYGIEDFAFVTGLNCEPGSLTSLVPGNRKEKRKRRKEDENDGEIWSSLFFKAENPTAELIADKLKKKRCKDPLKVFRLALILLIEGIICPTSSCGTTPLRREIVEMVGDVEGFMKRPWGRESFLLTVQSVKSKTTYHYATQASVALQGFSHAMLLVAVCCCPAIIGHTEEDVSPEETLQSVLGMKLAINVPNAKKLDQGGQAKVKALLVEQWEESLGLDEEMPDLGVDHLLALIANDYPFNLSTWTGGVTADEAVQNPHNQSDVRDGESSGNADVTHETQIEEYLEVVSEPIRKERSDKLSLQSLKEYFEKEIRDLKDQMRDQNDQMREQNDEIRNQMRDQNDEIRHLKEEIRHLKGQGMYNDNEREKRWIQPDMDHNRIEATGGDQLNGNEADDGIPRYLGQSQQHDINNEVGDDAQAPPTSFVDPLKKTTKQTKKRKGFDGGSGANKSREMKTKKQQNREDEEDDTRYGITYHRRNK